MAASEVTKAICVYNSAVAVTADAYDAANEHVIDLEGYDFEKLIVRLYGGTAGNGSDVAYTANFESGTFPDGKAGDLAVTVNKLLIHVVQLESARFVDTKKLNITMTNATNSTPAGATVEAYIVK